MKLFEYEPFTLSSLILLYLTCFCYINNHHSCDIVYLTYLLLLYLAVNPCDEVSCDEAATCSVVDDEAVCTCNRGSIGNGFFCEPGMSALTRRGIT